MKNVFIVVISNGWFGISRLPKALKNEGFTVITLSPGDQLLNRSLFIDLKYTFSNRWEFRNVLLDIVKKHNIDFIVPGCDCTADYFCRIVLRKNLFQKSMSNLRELIQQSWNNVNAFGLLGNKASLQAIAVKYGIHNPNNAHFYSKHELLNEARKRKYPIVLKEDFGAGGLGVKICNSYDEVLKAVKILNTSSVKLKVEYRIISGIGNLFALPYGKKNFGLSIQDYIEGTPCMHVVFASKGEILSSMTLLKVCCQPFKTSPSSVIKAIKHPEISEVCATIIREMKVTGFLSFDFILDKHNDAYLLECNPRPTPVVHLSHLCGGNLCAMLRKHLMPEDTNLEPYPEVVHEYIALFPNELKRDPQSEYLTKGYHDVPFDDYELLEELTNDLLKVGISYKTMAG